MLSMAGVSTTGIASLDCETVAFPSLLGSTLQFAQVAGVHELTLSVEGMNRGSNCSRCHFQIMSPT